MDNFGAAPVVAAAALCIALYQDATRKIWLTVAATAVAVGSFQYLTQSSKGVEAVPEKDCGDDDDEKEAPELIPADPHDDPHQAPVAGEHDPAPAGAPDYPGAAKPPQVPSRSKKPAAHKAVVFDFDKCLMRDHWWAKYRTRPLEQINPKPAHFGHDDIGGLLERMLNINGVIVCVASFGRHDVIAKAIRSSVSQTLADRVFITTPGDFEGYTDGCSMGTSYKNRELNLICDKYGIAPQDIVFFDDSRDNVAHARELGCAAHVTMPFTRDHESLIIDHLGVEI